MAEQPHFSVLGPLEVTRAGQSVRVGGARQKALLASLLLRADRAVSIADLTDRLWNDKPPAGARRTIQVYIVRLRRALGSPELIQVDPTGYHIRVEPRHLDLLRFDALVQDAAKTADTHKQAELLTAALELWRGPACSDVPSDVLQAVDIPPLHERRLDAEEQLIDAELALGRHTAQLPRLRELATEHPLRERFAGQLMLALYRSGRQADALDVYRSTAAILADELGLTPGPELRDLHQAVLTSDPHLFASVPVTRQSVPAQLPADSARFTGRSAELDELLSLPARGEDAPTAVLISAIDGMAGIGKTALAIHAAHRLAPDFPDGQLFIDLHGYTQGVPPVDPADALDRMLRTLDVPGTQVPTGLEDRAALYRSILSGRRMLIVLDNANSDTQIRPLLPGHSGCLVLITSRQRLTVVDSIHQLTLDVLPVADATALFTRVTGLESSPHDVTEIVELCGRLPLAIRIAAARLRSRPTWPVGHLADRLRNQRLDGLETGQTSVTAAFDLSYHQLGPDQQRAFRLLGVHPGSDIDPYAAAALTDTPVEAATRLLDDLVDTHLLQEPAASRYQFHDLVRAYARSRDTSDNEREAALDRLFDHYAHAATTAMDLVHPYETEQRPHPHADPRTPAPRFDLPAQAEAWLDVELPNLLAAAGNGAPGHTLHLSATLYRHLRIRGRYDAAIGLHRYALTAARHTGDRAGELTALTNLAWIHRAQGSYGPATEAYEQALAIARSTGDLASQGKALAGLAWLHKAKSRYEAAAELYQEVLAIARSTGDHDAERNAFASLGRIHYAQGRYGAAAEAYEQALAIARASGHHIGELAALHSLGDVHFAQGRHQQSIDIYTQVLESTRSSGNRNGEMTTLISLGKVHLAQGKHERAADAYTRALDTARDIGDRNAQFEALHGLGRSHHAAGRHDEALACHRRALTAVGDLGQPPDEARAHDGIADTHRMLGDQDRAREHWRSALRILEAAGLDHTDDPRVTADTIRSRLAELGHRVDVQ